jgi:glycosyltransferase involved in cell wall biosynthesis
VKIKNSILHYLLPSKLPTKLFACSNHVLKTVKLDPYLAKFQSTFSHNPVEPVARNPYSFRDFKQLDEINVGMVSRLDPIKDHETVLNALPAIIKFHPQLVLHFVGDGVLRQELELSAKVLGVEKNTVFHGNKNDIYKMLKTWDIFVYSTTMLEGLGNVVTEALCNGLPLVLSDLPMLKEIVGESQAAVFFTPKNAKDLEDKLLALLSNYTLRKEMSANGYIHGAEHFHPNKYIQTRHQFLFLN